jgi:uncharacterized protein (TIGR04255 family)
MKLPKKLTKEPLVDALFEVRILPTIPAAAGILPGVLLPAIQAPGLEPLKIERLQVAEIPSQVRTNDPFLKYQALLRISSKNFMILVGDWSVAVGCHLPYAGWSAFKPKIIDVMAALKNSGFVKELERYSMKYVDIVEQKTLGEQIRRANMEIRIGSQKLTAEPFEVRLEFKHGEFTNLLHLAGQAQVLLSSGETRNGLLIDVDTIVEHKTVDLEKFARELPDRLERIHTENKTRVFECLTPEAIKELGPEYDSE